MKNKIYILIILLSLPAVSDSQICVGDEGSVSWEAWLDLPDREMSALTSREFYPNIPEVEKTLYKVDAPYNYADYFGVRVRGFIKVPSNSAVEFNITGDSYVEFYLSSDENPDNKVLQAYTYERTGEEEHDKFPEQTSQLINLQAGQHYYFEVIHLDNWGTDHASLWWKADFLSNSEWNIISSSYLNNIGCLPPQCPKRGTACDDGDPNTINDTEDGHCNCVGRSVSSDTCIGQNDLIEVYTYTGIPGSSLNDLYESTNFPAMPSTSRKLSEFSTDFTSMLEDNGSLYQGYLSVPVTGEYRFNVTGDDNTVFYISSDNKIENKTTNEARVPGYTGASEHDKYPEQTSEYVSLQAGQYYYVELNHKNGYGGNRIGVFWETPFTQDTTWKILSSFYLSSYNCSLACIPEGTACDDGDPYTNNDQYNDNCECIGTPCSGPDCDDPAAYYEPYEKCALTDQLGNQPENNWLSCEKTENPNPDRSASHWIQYELDERHQLLGTQVWNYNVQNELDKGFSTVAVDYSLDGQNWTNLGTYNWPLATGEPQYSGFIGPDFGGVFAKYVLFTCLDSSPECKGLGKVAFEAIKCPNAGTPCDDGDPTTVNDQYISNCECAGEDILVNNCDTNSLVIPQITLFTGIHSSEDFIRSTSIIDNASQVSFLAQDNIVLNPGFESLPNSKFIAAIADCEPEPMKQNEPPTIAMIKNSSTENLKKQQKTLEVIPIENSNKQLISFYLDSPQDVKLSIETTDGQELYTLIRHNYMNSGFYQKVIRTKKLNKGLYSVNLTTERINTREKMNVAQTTLNNATR